MAFQELEEFLSAHIGGLISNDLHLGNIITAGMSFRNKVALLSSLYLYRAKFAKPPDILEMLLSRLNAAEQRRNTILHSYWAKSLACGALTRYKYTAKAKHGFAQQTEEFVPDQIEAIAAEIEQVATDFSKHMVDVFPDHSDLLENLRTLRLFSVIPP